VMVCRLLEQSTPKQIPPLLTDVCKQVAPLLKGLPSVAQVINGLQSGTLPPLPVPLTGGGR
jgi:phospholipid/cholesterol/gamma-HCH transport system substrate-binding protein